MAAKNCYLKNSFYQVQLPKQIFCGSFLARIIIGDITDDLQCQLKFGPKSVNIPSDRFYQFVKVIQRFKKALKENQTEPFEEVICQTSKSHQLVALYNEYYGAMKCSIRLRWFFKNDRSYQSKLSLGLVDEIKSKEPFIFLTRGFGLDEEMLDVLNNNLCRLMESCFYQHPNTALKMKEFVDYLVNSQEHKSYIEEVLKSYPDLKFHDKVEFLQKMADFYWIEKGLEVDDFAKKSFCEGLAAYMVLIFALVQFHLG